MGPGILLGQLPGQVPWLGYDSHATVWGEKAGGGDQPPPRCPRLIEGPQSSPLHPPATVPGQLSVLLGWVSTSQASAPLPGPPCPREVDGPGQAASPGLCTAVGCLFSSHRGLQMTGPSTPLRRTTPSSTTHTQLTPRRVTGKAAASLTLAQPASSGKAPDLTPGSGLPSHC